MITSQQKRFALMDLDLPFNPGMGLPDGDMAQGDREALLWLYDLLPDVIPGPGLIFPSDTLRGSITVGDGPQ